MYRARLPNGANVAGVAALGHVNPKGGVLVMPLDVISPHLAKSSGPWHCVERIQMTMDLRMVKNWATHAVSGRATTRMNLSRRAFLIQEIRTLCQPILS